MMTNTKSSRNQDGFTLVEMAIMITVLGLVLAPFFGFLAVEYREKQAVADEARNERITAAISRYVDENDRYPCPANPSLGYNAAGGALDPDFGVERRMPAAQAQCLDNVAIIPTIGVHAFYGDIPVVTLGLKSEDAFNNDGWKYIYIVDSDADSDTDPSGNTPFTIRIDQNGDGDVTDPSDLTRQGMAFIIVNPGRDGLGARNKSGQIVNMCGPAGNRSVNCDFTTGDENLAFEDHALAHTAAANPFDDILIYSLLRKESTHYELLSVDQTGGGGVIRSRQTGNQGIGTRNPEAVLHVEGGDGRIHDGLLLDADEDIELEADIITPGQVETETIGAGQGFFYCGGGDLPAC